MLASAIKNLAVGASNRAGASSLFKNFAHFQFADLSTRAVSETEPKKTKLKIPTKR
jgi:hypothetical protein